MANLNYGSLVGAYKWTENISTFVFREYLYLGRYTITHLLKFWQVHNQITWKNRRFIFDLLASLLEIALAICCCPVAVFVDGGIVVDDIFGVKGDVIAVCGVSGIFYGGGQSHFIFEHRYVFLHGYLL